MLSDQTSARFLTVEQIADDLQISHRTVYNWVRTGKLPALKLGARCWRIDGGDLAVFLRSKDPHNGNVDRSPRSRR